MRDTGIQQKLKINKKIYPPTFTKLQRQKAVALSWLGLFEIKLRVALCDFSHVFCVHFFRGAIINNRMEMLQLNNDSVCMCDEKASARYLFFVKMRIIL